MFRGGMQRARRTATEMALEQRRGFERALYVGDGDGRGAELFAALEEDCELQLLDSSQAFLARAQERLDGAGHRATYRRVDLPGGDWDGDPFDLIATHFFLDCFEPPELGRVISELSSQASPGALWIHSDFRRDPSGWRGLWTGTWLALLYPFFRWTTGIRARRLVEPDADLSGSGWQRLDSIEVGSLWRASVWQRLDPGSPRATAGPPKERTPPV